MAGVKRWFSCRFEVDVDPDDPSAEPGTAEDALATALQTVGALDPVVGGTAVDRIGAVISVAGKDALVAAGVGLKIFARALSEAGIRVTGEGVEVEVMTHEELELSNELGGGVREVGASDIARFLGVSRQRVYQLREAGALPQPVGDGPRGAVWERRAITRWAMHSGRRGGDGDASRASQVG